MLATAVGLEREVSAKSAGLRTHALVGLGAAAFMLVPKYGFDDLTPGATHPRGSGGFDDQVQLLHPVDSGIRVGLQWAGGIDP